MTRALLSEKLYKLKLEGKCRCCRCKEVKLEVFFSKGDLSRKYPYCISCRNNSSEKSKPRRQERSLIQSFGITKEQYIYLLKKQENKCAICNKEETFVNCYTKEVICLAVDHNHETLEIRGLLCRNCNLLIAHAKDSVRILKSAINYLNDLPVPVWALPQLLTKQQELTNE